MRAALSAAELRIVFGAFVRRETIVYSAQRWLTARSIYLRIKRLIGSRKSLRDRASGWVCSQGVAGFTVRHDDSSESVVMFITRSGDFRGPDEIDLVIYDEAYNLTESAMAAISPTQLAARNSQTIYLSSAVNEEIHAMGPPARMASDVPGSQLRPRSSFLSVSSRGRGSSLFSTLLMMRSEGPPGPGPTPLLQLPK